MRIYVDKNILALRLKKKLTQEQLADELKVTRAALSAWEENRNQPNLETIVKLSKYFKVPIKNLITHKYKSKKSIYKINRVY